MKKHNILLFFGSFNPVHNGHTSVARYVLSEGLCDELWLVVSPRNPLKEDSVLAHDEDRLEMTRLAVAEELPGLPVRVCDIEFSMPRPSYTIDTMRVLASEYPDHDFSILAGTDILADIGRWKESAELVSSFRFLIYPRAGYGFDAPGANFVYLEEAPCFEYSSSDVRRVLEGGGDIGGMVAPGVRRYIERKGLWSAGGEAALRIGELSERIETDPSDAALYMERGKLYYNSGEFGPALNDFLRVLKLDPAHEQAREYEKLLRGIFEFRYMDYYNP